MWPWSRCWRPSSRGDVHHNGLQQAVWHYIYAPYQQAAWPAMYVVVRSGQVTANLEMQVRQALRRVAPDQPVTPMRRMEDVFEGSLGQVLYGVAPSDPVTLSLGALLLATVALLASLWPAVKATRVDPALVLRSDG